MIATVFTVRSMSMFPFEPWFEGELGFPEQRLWCAVVLCAVQDYVECLQHCLRRWQAENRPVDRSFKLTLEQLRRQCEHPWFGSVCDFAGFSHDHILKRLNKLDREYCIGSITFEKIESNGLSEWQLRQRKRKRKYVS